MRLGLVFLAAAIAAISGFWVWLGAPVAMPPSPLAAGSGKLFCVSYAPFRGAQNPFDPSIIVSAQQIEDDLARLSRITDCVRTYAIDNGLDQIAPLAGKHGLKVIQGLWLSSHPERNEQQIATVIALANRYRDVIRSVVVGNEVLLRGEMSAVDLAAIVRRVKAAVPVPVTYADVWEFWLRNAALAQDVDFITIHILPYWEDFPVSATQAASHVEAIRARVAAAFPGKEVLIGEFGWPSAGRMREGALPSRVNQARVLHEVLAAEARTGTRVNVIEAFDQPWKRRLEGTVGGYWGLFDGATRTPKFVWGAPVSDHPSWRWQALAGVLLAAAVFAAALWGARGKETPPGAGLWGAIAIMAAVSGALFGWTMEKMALEGFTLGGWLRSIALTVVAAAAPVLAGAALTRRTALLRFAVLLGGEKRAPADALALAVTACLAAVCAMAVQAMLGLTFDPRYRDFPFTALGSAVVPYLLLAFRRDIGEPGAGTAERVMAAVLALSGVYVLFNEGLANWQSLATFASVAALAVSLLRVAGVRARE